MQDLICPLTDAGGNVCGEPVPPDVPVGICAEHMMQAHQYIKSAIAKLDADPDLRLHRMTSFVYYIRDGDSIKIGFSRNLWQRVNQIPGQLLAIEPGDAHVERLRHAEFADLRIGHSEWFRNDGGELWHHVNELRRQFGDPLARRYEHGRLRPLWRLPAGSAD